MISRRNPIVFCLVAGFFWAVFAGGLSGTDLRPPTPAQTLGLEHKPITTFSSGENLLVSAVARGEVEWVTLYFRTPDLRTFQARPMKNTEGAVYTFELDTSTLVGASFEYYIEAEKSGRKVRVPAGGADEPARVAGTGGEDVPPIPANLASPQEEEAKIKLPLHANGSLLGSMTETSAGQTFTNPTGNGNVQVLFEAPSTTGLGIRLDSNFSLTNSAPPDDPAVNLTNMNVALSKGNHALRMGDVNINESEFTSFGFGRRGIEYAFDNQKIYLHAFDVNTRELRGFRGFGLPASGMNILGAAAGLKFFQEALSFRAIYVGGTDDPSRAANAASSPYFQSREGRVLAVLQEVRLFKNQLSFKAELARSDYDGDLNDETGALSDNAWNVGGNLAIGGLSVGAIYRHIGRDFNSIGLPFMANDRRGLETNLMFSKGPVGLQGQFALQQDNVRDDPLKYTTEAANGQLGLNLALSSKISVNTGYRLNIQKTRLGAEEAGLQDTRTDEINGTVNLMVSGSSNFTVGLTDSRLSSRTNPSADTEGLTFNLGGSFQAGEQLTLAPTFGLSRTKNRLTGDLQTTLNAFVSAEAFFVPKILSLTAVGSFNRMEMAVLSVSKALDLTGGLNFYLGRLVGLNNFLLTLKAQHRSNVMSGQTLKETRILTQADLSF